MKPHHSVQLILCFLHSIGNSIALTCKHSYNIENLSTDGECVIDASSAKPKFCVKYIGLITPSNSTPITYRGCSTVPLNGVSLECDVSGCMIDTSNGKSTVHPYEELICCCATQMCNEFDPELAEGAKLVILNDSADSTTGTTAPTTTAQSPSFPTTTTTAALGDGTRTNGGVYNYLLVLCAILLIVRC